jgi:ribosomal protein S7
MHDGKKSVALSVFYDALSIVEERGRGGAIDAFELALRNATPVLEVKPAGWVARPIRSRLKSGATAGELLR